jgi:geranylgeranyl diphosphate synthase type I
MYLLKTTRYTFEAPMVIGGLLAGASSEVLEELARVINPIGLAFQIQNDLVEYRQFKGVDRLRQTDLLEGKKTYLLRTAFERLEPVDQSILQLCLSSGLPNDASVTKIEQLIDKSGAVGELTAEVERLFTQSETELDNLEPLSADQRTGLRETFALVRQVAQQSS